MGYGVLERSQALKTKANQAASEQGQATLEYILLMSAVLFGVFLFTKGITTSLDKGVLFIGASLEKDLKSGRAKYDSWKN